MTTTTYTNKVQLVLAAVRGCFTSLISAGTIKELLKRPIDLVKQQLWPAVAVYLSNVDNSGGPADKPDWTGHVAIEIAVEQAGDVEAKITQLLAEVEDALLSSYATDGTAGGVIANRSFAFSYDDKANWMLIGAVGDLTIRIAGPLKVTTTT